MRQTFRSVVLGLTGIGIFMLVVLHPSVFTGITSAIQKTITGAIRLGGAPS